MRLHATLICLLTVMALPVCADPAAPAAQAIALLKTDSNAVYDELAEGFRRTCPYRIDEFNMRGRLDAGSQQILQVNGGQYDLLVAVGAAAAELARQRSRIPVVFCGVFSADRRRLAGKNITGITLDASIMTQFAAFKRLIPRLKTIGVIYDPRISAESIAEAHAACNTLQMRLEARAVSSPKEVTWAGRDLIAHVDLLWMIADSTVVNPENFRYLLLTCIENKAPLAAFSQTFVKEGALVSIAATNEEIGGEIAQLVSAILGGQAAGSLAVTAPKHAGVFLNLKTARTLGFTIPQSLLAEATVYGGRS